MIQWVYRLLGIGYKRVPIQRKSISAYFQLIKIMVNMIYSKYFTYYTIPVYINII